MTTEIICSLLALLGTLGGSLGGILVSNRLSNYRVEQLEKKIEKLNTALEKIANIELHLAVIDERIDMLEGKK